MTNTSKITVDHKKIIHWAEKRGGKPAVVRNTQKEGQGRGLLRINFPHYSNSSSLEEISWEEFFKTFEEMKLAFLYQEKTSDEKESRFFKLITRK